MRTGMASLPLHGGQCPPWLFARMRQLGPAIMEVISREHGPQEALRRLADPVWFQALGCVLGFDWHSSGLTTTLLGALKDGSRGREADLGFFVAGGKGRTSRATPAEIEAAGDKFGLSLNLADLKQVSRLVAKVDNTALQDGYQLYHHVFLFTPQGEWAVIQQGMHEGNRLARRYHWLGETVADFVCEPHHAVCCDRAANPLNLVARESEAARRAVAELARQQPDKIVGELKRIVELDGEGGARNLKLAWRHDIPRADYLNKALLQVYASQPADFAAVLGVAGVGPKTLRALALVAEVAYGAPASFRDPVKYSFSHGGKDGYPFPVDRRAYDRSIAVLEGALKAAKIGQTDKLQALKKLGRFYS